LLRHLIALFALLALPGTAQALELGVQDDGRQSSAVAQDVDALNGHWTRTIAYVGQPGVAQRIRDAHSAGLRIILTVGGTGTKTRRPNFAQALRYISSLPRADRYTIDNEPDLDGVKACTYRRGWMKARRRLGRRLLFGDFSPHRPLTFTAAVRRCGPLPRNLDMAIHPYQSTDPLARSEEEGGLGDLGYAKRWLRKNVAVRVTWWITEFGYLQDVDSVWKITDAQAAWLWPRAIRQATRNHARVLIAYTAQGQSWDTRPGPLAWCSMTLGRACPGAVAPEVHREPVTHAIRHADPVVLQMLAYASA
jgi:hypothetical protein